MNSVINSLGCMVGGISFIPEEPCKNNPTNSSAGIQGSGLGFVSQGISIAFTPPLSTTEYLADVGANLGLVKPAQAQMLGVDGSGESIIAQVKRLWTIMRNLSYVMFTLVFMVVGMMVMFRRKMNAQTVVNIQTALPGLIIGLALVSLSYLIAAFIIDLTFVLMPVVAGIFDWVGPNSNIFQGTPSGWLKSFDGSPFSQPKTLVDYTQNIFIFDIFKGFLYNNLFYVDMFGDTTMPGFSITAPLQSIIDWLTFLPKFAINAIVGIIVLFALFFQMLTLLAILLRAYVSILYYTAVGPILILMGSIPGRGATITNWWKSLLANALIFPAVLAGFFFAGMILADDPALESQFMNTMPFFAGLPVQMLKYMLGLIVLLGTPAIPGMVKEALGVKDVKGIPEMAMGAFGNAAKPITGAVSAPFRSLVKDYEIEKEAERKYRIEARAKEWEQTNAARTKPKRPFSATVGRALSPFIKGS